jgi:hypothetical protein
MPPYPNNPFQTPQLAQKGVPTYLLGAFDFKVANSRFYLTNVALTSDVATLTVQLLGGPMPKVGDLVSVVNSNSTTGLFNVNRATITAVAIDAKTGAGTLTFALTHADVAGAADSGTVITESSPVPETLVAGASQACVFQMPDEGSQFTVPVAVNFPTLPTAATVHLQAALRNIDSEFTNVDGSNPVAVVAAAAQTVGPFSQVTLQRGYLYRFIVSGITGTGTIIAKLGA